MAHAQTRIPVSADKKVSRLAVEAGKSRGEILRDAIVSGLPVVARNISKGRKPLRKTSAGFGVSPTR